MTAPSYTTDLVDITDAESGGTWLEMGSPYNAGGSKTESADYFIQGTQAAIQALSASKSGLLFSSVFDSTADQSGSFGTDDCVFMWQILAYGAALATYANGGLRLVIGSNADIDNADAYAVGGSDYGRNPYGGWQNVVVDPTNTADYTIGSGNSGSWRYFGSMVNTIATISKGEVHGVDAIRRGRGELIIEYGETDDYATFAGLATENDKNVTSYYHRWGLFQAIPGGYLWKGLMSLGNATNAVDFRDSNRNIYVDDTPKTFAAFNKIEVTNGSSNIEWTGINITSLIPSGLSIGQFEMINDATLSWTNCVMTDLSTFIFDSNATLDAVTFRRCALVTQAGADIDNCIFDEATGAVALLVDNPDNIDNCSFVSDGTGHAIELTSACSGNSYTLTDFFVSGYATSDGSTGNEVIYNNSGGTVTINVDGGSGVSALSIRGGNVTLVANYSFTVTGLESGTEVTIVTSGTSTVLHHTESAVTSDGDGKYQITYSHGGGATVDVLIHHIDYKPDISNIYGLTLPGNNSSAKVNMFADENYENP